MTSLRNRRFLLRDETLSPSGPHWWTPDGPTSDRSRATVFQDFNIELPPNHVIEPTNTPANPGPPYPPDLYDALNWLNTDPDIPSLVQPQSLWDTMIQWRDSTPNNPNQVLLIQTIDSRTRNARNVILGLLSQLEGHPPPRKLPRIPLTRRPSFRPSFARAEGFALGAAFMALLSYVVSLLTS